MGYKEKRGKASWRLIVDVGYDAQGNRVQEKKTIKVKDPILLRAPKRLEDYLETQLTLFQVEVEAGNYIRPEHMPFEDLVKRWTVSFVNKHLEEKTKESYLYQVNARNLPYFRLMHADEITQSHINDYLDFLHTPAARLDGKDKLLGSASIVNWKILKSSPMDGIQKPKETDVKEMQYYNEQEISALFEALKDEPLRLRAQIMIAVTTGLRRAEVAGLEWEIY